MRPEPLAESANRPAFAKYAGQGFGTVHRTPDTDDQITLKVGTLDDASGISPRGHLWVSKKQPWIVIPEGVPAFETQPEDVQAWRESLGQE